MINIIRVNELEDLGIGARVNPTVLSGAKEDILENLLTRKDPTVMGLNLDDFDRLVSILVLQFSFNYNLYFQLCGNTKMDIINSLLDKENILEVLNSKYAL